MATGKLDTKTLTPGDVVNIDGIADAVFVGEFPKGYRYLPETPSGIRNERYFSLLELLEWAGLKNDKNRK